MHEGAMHEGAMHEGAMHERLVAAICARYGLGAPTAPPVAVPGGRLHRVWKLVTTSGAYAVKVLNPARPGYATAARGGGPWTATELAAAALAESGIPAVAALWGLDGPVSAMNHVCVLVYPWVAGATARPGAADPDRARQIGALLGHIHAARLDPASLAERLPPRADGKVWDTHDFALPWELDAQREDGWVLLARRGIAAGAPWGEPLRALRRSLALWATRARQALPDLYRTQVFGHRDLNQPNVLWRTPTVPAIIDWEYAGMAHPTVDLADVALNWSGITLGPPDAAAFAAVLAGYRAVGGTLQADGRDTLFVTLWSWLDWVRYTAPRSLGDGGATAEERAIGMRETLTTLAAVRELGAHLDLWASRLEQGLEQDG
jgi:Ser/Thr protein kinase RdoA (MazF antagonist)